MSEAALPILLAIGEFYQYQVHMTECEAQGSEERTRGEGAVCL